VKTTDNIHNLITLESVPSTNDYLKELSAKQKKPEGFAVFSKTQTKGKGQKENRWETEKGKNIALSMLFYPEFLPINRSFLLSEAIALGVKDAIEEESLQIEIKFPNDIYHKNQKLGGILMENEIIGTKITSTIAGIGLNVNQETFPKYIPNPISLKQILNREITVETLLEKLISQIKQRYSLLKNGNTAKIIRDYHDALYRKSGIFQYQDKNSRFKAETVKVSDNGILYLKTTEKEERKYACKEIKFL
jgi:BirA family biotin operon repressor/biotin-[acetyl-CoA-carboxylase] ligase